MTKEKKIERIIKECADDGMPVTRAEAEEMAEMETKAEEIKIRGDAGTKAERKPRPRKVDETKKKILDSIRVIIEGMQLNNDEPTNTAIKTETELIFTYNGELYTLKLTKHRQKKGD